MRAYIFVIEGRDTSGKIVCFITCLKRIPRLFVVWHGKSSVVIILYGVNYTIFFDRFSSRNTCNSNIFMLYCVEMVGTGRSTCHRDVVVIGFQSGFIGEGSNPFTRTTKKP